MFTNILHSSSSVVDPHGSASFWRPDYTSASNKNPDLHPDLQQIKIRIRFRIKVISWIRNQIRIRNNLQLTSKNVWNMSLFEHFFKSFSLYLEARIWIRIRIRVKSRIQIRAKQNPDPHQINVRFRIRIRIRIRVISQFRICVKVMQIHNLL
jgi:hypothetical protein